MTLPARLTLNSALAAIDPDRPVLIAGPTACGKSALALEIAAKQGGMIINADASQVYDCWRIVTARPSASEEACVPHSLYGHQSARATYSTGHWLRDVAPLLKQKTRPIIVGGTGLYFSALTRGLADIPLTPPDVRAAGDLMARDDMIDALDPETRDLIDTRNRARVQRAWEVLKATGRGLAAWQKDTGAPLLPLEATQGIVFDAPKDWLNARIEERFERMIDAGALDEARSVLPDFDANLPAHRAIGAPELIAYLRGEITLEQARTTAVIATRRFAKRQRTWMRSKMQQWQWLDPFG
ncbi:MAG: tRNA (adenosine(37)-N6)-dimethylallyltransferase MiaA [Roseobacter sp.]